MAFLIFIFPHFLTGPAYHRILKLNSLKRYSSPTQAIHCWYKRLAALTSGGNNPQLTIVDLAKHSQFNDKFIRKHLTLTRLSPTIVHEVLTGKMSKQMLLNDLFDAAGNYLREKQINARVSFEY